MNVVYSAKARDLAEGYFLVPQAMAQLETIVGSCGEQVTAEWDRRDDAGDHPEYMLTLRDSTGEVQARFSPEGLAVPSYVTACLYRLWGDLLQRRSDEQHSKLLQLVAQLEGNEECPGQPTTSLSGS